MGEKERRKEKKTVAYKRKYKCMTVKKGKNKKNKQELNNVKRDVEFRLVRIT